MKLWIFLAIAILLIVWGSREGFGAPPIRIQYEEPTEVYADPSCPSGTTLDSRKKCIYPDGVEMIICPSDHIPTASRTCRNRQTNAETPPQCPSGKVFDSDRGGCIKEDAPGICPSGYSLRVLSSSNTCFKPTVSTPTTGTTAGGTTGGSSDSSAAPNSGGASNRSKQVFGPTFTGFGEGGVVPSDSSKTNQYPELLGGGNTRPSTRTEGGGITSPSKSWQLSMDGSLPTTAGLGADENSKYLPFSRQPGDMELIPDPYRVSQQFSAANLSSKTEPVPFLTDFSAFQR